MPRARWNEQLIAESDETVQLDGNHYFPLESLRMQFFQDSAHRSHCSWKGEASYYDILVDGELNERAAWVYRDPLPAAESIRDRVAFWRGVEVSD